MAKRSSHSTIVQLAFVLGRPVASAFFSRFLLAAIGRRKCSPSCKSSLGIPFQKKVQEACIVA
eukprot:8874971-Ditylum_brightwellii.AAC.1